MKITFVATLFAISAVPQLAGAALTVNTTPTADAFVVSATPANNYGAAGSLSAAAAALPKGQFDSVLRVDTAATKTSFDAAFGAGQWSIQSVTLRLTAAAPNNAIFNASSAGQFAASWMQDDSWIEGTGTPATPTTTGITFNSLPSFLGPNDAPLGSFNFPGGTSGSLTFTLALPAAFVNDILAGNLVSIHMFAADSAVSYLFNSRTFGTATARPEFSITAIPEPTTGLLLALAALRQLTRSRRPARSQ